ncbi:MAG: HAD-IC family P-type ATPase, partial [Methanoregula sp.]
MLTSDNLASLSGSNGLSSDQVPTLRSTYGENVLTPPLRDPLLKQYLAQFKSPLIRILLLAVIVSGIIAVIENNGYPDTVAIIVAVFLATGISFASEYKSNKEFEILNTHRDDIPVKVIRDGMPRIIPAREVVVGDLILLEAGDVVPADGYCRKSDGLSLDEATFTGESEPVQKNNDDELYRGTFVRAGKGQMQGAAVGDATRMGTIAHALGIDHTTPTPLTEKLSGLAGIISRFGYIMAALIILSLVIRGYLIGDISGLNLDTARHLVNYLILAVTIIVVAVPEGLPMSVALSLSLAMQKMTRAHCLVRKLVACETIGSATIICTDKTGTLTKNQMNVVESSTGSPMAGTGLPQSPSEWVTLNAAVNSTAHITTQNGTPVIIGNITEGALLRWLEDARIDYRAVRAGYPVETQQLFDGTRKRMSSIVTIGNRQWLLVKGAPEIIASRCTGTVDLDTVNASAARAMRTLAFAHREIANGNDDETGLAWDGYVGIRDALRENIGSSVAACHRAGVRVCMITGDNPETAKAIARETGILTTGSVMTGAGFRALTEKE